MEKELSPHIERLREVLHRTGLSRSTLYLRIANGEFPKPMSLGGRSVGWLASDVTQWIESLKGDKNDH
ncbi:MAG TPA: AlpA family transcriptional regulator [Alphaproteobacteria bacterium]|nr:AlpA family transcriptional regulator [Alphaproteobacteria bacterium]